MSRIFCFALLVACLGQFHAGIAPPKNVAAQDAAGQAVQAEDVPAADVSDASGAFPLRWWKGNIHTHSLWSDGNDFPEMIADWYVAHDYNFLALTDHNVLSEGQRWMKLGDIRRRGGTDALTKYRQRFGTAWVETRGEEGSDDLLVRLKPLTEFRPLVEKRGEFLMLQGEEISDKFGGKPIHMNATNLKVLQPPVGGTSVQETIRNNLRAIQQQAERTGRSIILHLNHPNFGYAVTAEDMAAVTEERFFEVYNGHPAVGHEGNAGHPSVERLWDIANTLRVGELQANLLLGVATDDSHKYHGRPGSRPGRGWIMVQASYLTPEHIVKAIEAGHFYASSGVTLDEVSWQVEDGRMQLKIRPDDQASYVTEFIGTRRDYDRSTEERVDSDGKPAGASRIYSADVGQVLARVEGDLNPGYTFEGDELYVRAVVTSSLAHSDPSFKEQKQQAWTQPLTIIATEPVEAGGGAPFRRHAPEADSPALPTSSSRQDGPWPSPRAATMTQDIPVLVDGPTRAKATLILAHGAGAGMSSEFMQTCAAGLAALKFRVIRFEFAYMRQRAETGKSRPPDRQPVLLECWRDVIRQTRYQRCFIGGKSMGGRMASLIADEMQVAGLICLGYPFHPPGKPDQLRTEHLRQLKTPTLILQGERDPFGRVDEVANYDLAASIEFHWLPDGEHSFKPRKSSGTTWEANLELAIQRMAQFMQA